MAFRLHPPSQCEAPIGAGARSVWTHLTLSGSVRDPIWTCIETAQMLQNVALRWVFTFAGLRIVTGVLQLRIFSGICHD
jgi:hypothetical protein